ncbi:hypothetical protein [Aminobacter aminovorans]|uniref:Uncharacterized protein n=1 Tax=Aminobacter aminovorans TaxID=83263 RepID=A0ABR6HH24_AMIAI|nr:hypothetical protein [Aminobacter aminovorans]MBB3709863.1 hypothetical protein [Aminobacter aminovorans]
MNGKLVAKNTRATVTINHFRLNRPELVVRRGEALETYVWSLQRPDLHVRTQSERYFKADEFGGSKYLLARRLALRLDFGKLSKQGPQDVGSVLCCGARSKPACLILP